MFNEILGFFGVRLGFETDTSKIEEFKRQSEQLRSSVLALGGLLTGAAVGVGLFVRHVAEGMGELEHFAELNQLSARSVAAWNKLAAENLIPAESAQQSLQAVNTALGGVLSNMPRAVMLFERLGLSARHAGGQAKTLDDILGDLAEKMAHRSRAANIAMAERLGLDPHFVPLLEKGREAFMRLREEAEQAVPFSDEQYKQAEEIEKSFRAASRAIGVLSKQIAIALFPVVKRALDGFLQWYKNLRQATNSQFMQALKLLAAVMGEVWDWVERLVRWFTRLVGWLDQFRVVSWGARIALAALIGLKAYEFFTALGSAIGKAAKALFSFNMGMLPTVGMVALIALIGLLINELVRYYGGQESVISLLEKDFPHAIHAAWGALVLLIGGFIALKWAAIKSMLETMYIVGLYAAAWIKAQAAMLASMLRTAVLWTAITARLAIQWITAHLSMAAATLAAYWPILLIIAAIVLVVAAVWYLWKNWDQVTEWISKAWDAVTARVMKFVDLVTGAIHKVGELLGLTGDNNGLFFGDEGGLALAAAGGPGATGGLLGKAETNSSNSVVSQTTQITGTQITVVSPDPDKAGQKVKEALSDHATTAIRNGHVGYY
jgi:hypothetical protein